MKYLLTRLILFLVTVQLLVACTAMQSIGPVSGSASLQNQRSASASLELDKLEEIDALIKLDNGWLAEQIKSAFNAQTTSTGHYVFRVLKLNFVRQTIPIEAVIDISDEQGNIISASAKGEVLLDFNGEQLEWLPRFDTFRITSRNFVFENGTYAESIPELTTSSFEKFNSNIEEAIIERGSNIIPFTAVPLGDVQVGASLPGFSDSPAINSQELEGIFMVVGSTMLIDSSHTSIALDMAFIPDLSTCPADVTVSRAEFVTGIESREPEGIVTNLNDAPQVRYFFSEIRGASRPMNIIHYWFADGLPQATEELPVEPSERWRTWSGRGTMNLDARRWEVLVVEKESGCILYAKTIRVTDPEEIVAGADQAQARTAFTELKEKFSLRTEDFTIAKDKPDFALLEIKRLFYRDVLQAALTDLSIDAEFDNSTLSKMQFSASLMPFDAEEIICEYHECPSAQVCKADFTQCKRLRDTRDCTSCQFRNPLNNRCVSEVTDPLCEASRNRQNERYDAERAACIEDAEILKVECEQLARQAAESCRIESGFEVSVCESIKAGLQSMGPDTSLARVDANTRTNGTLSANFSNFRIEGNLERLKLDMILQPDLQLDGKLSFNTAGAKHPLADCIASWSAPFSNRFVNTPAVDNLLSNIEADEHVLMAHWSGLGMTIDTNPSPLESIFVANPRLLANCKMGLTVNKVEQAVRGDDAEFFGGHINLEIQPLPTVVRLGTTTIGFNGGTRNAQATLSDYHLRYEFSD